MLSGLLFAWILAAAVARSRKHPLVEFRRASALTSENAVYFGRYDNRFDWPLRRSIAQFPEPGLRSACYCASRNEPTSAFFRVLAVSSIHFFPASSSPAIKKKPWIVSG